MDNTTLSKEQLNVLMAYIRSRGFVEPFVIIEILDHFACKVEELMNNKHVSFEVAMQQAHESFGVAGFAPLVKSYYASLRKKYMTKYRQIMTRTLKSVLPMSLLVLVGFAYYKGYIWAAMNDYLLLNINVFSFIILAVMLTGIILLKGSFYKRENPVSNTIMGFDTWIFVIFISMQPSIDMHHSHAPVAIHIISVFQSLILIYSLLRIYCLHRTIKLAQHEIDASEQYYDTLMSA